MGTKCRYGKQTYLVAALIRVHLRHFRYKKYFKVRKNVFFFVKVVVLCMTSELRLRKWVERHGKNYGAVVAAAICEEGMVTH